MQTWTIQKLLNWITGYFNEKGVDAPRLRAELLLSHIFSMKRIELYTSFDKNVEKPLLDKLHCLVERAGKNEPIPYLIGKTQFYSIELIVSPKCLIPRPETEMLVQRAIEFLRARHGLQLVCDIGTGSACIAIAIAKNDAEAKIIATDISQDALKIAARNIQKHQLKKQITLLQGDLFEPIDSQYQGRSFDLVVCNPPYVSQQEYEKLDKNVKDYEPKSSLYAGQNGLEFHKRIPQEIERFLKPGGAVMLEIAYNQGLAVREMYEKTGLFSKITKEKDWQGNDRIVAAIKKSS